MSKGQARLFRGYRPGDRKTYFRENGGLRTDAPKLGPWLRRSGRAAVQELIEQLMVEELMVDGSKFVIQRTGRTWRVYFPEALKGRVFEALQRLRWAQRLEVCRTSTGFPQIGPDYSRVLWAREVIEVWARPERGIQS